MRLLPAIAGFLLIAGAAAAQSAPDSAPPAASAPTPPEQMAPPAGGQMAPPGGKMRFKDRFEAANTTHDGKLTLDQAKAAHMGMMVKNFDAIDADKKGYITLQDVRTWHEAKKAQQGK
jgi:hypothetical protein